jgi:urea transport system permease protein
VVNYAKTVFTSGFMAPYWLFALGALFVLVTLFMPKGILGTAQDLWSKRGKPAPVATAEPAPAE